MDKRRAEFLARLRETFRVEASEHIAAITAGLLSLERASAADRAPLVERVFRETHSFKGAARSVGLANVEALCAELESLFAAMKRQELGLSTELLDALHPALRALSPLCDSAAAPASPEVTAQVERALEALHRIRQGPAAPRPETQTFAALSHSVAPSSSAPELAPPEPTPETARAPRPRPAAASSDTVRMSTQRLGAMLLQVEELVGARIRATERAVELRALATDLADWNRSRHRSEARQRPDEDSTRALGLLDSEDLFARTLEGRVRKLAGTVQQDARDLSAIVDRLVEETRDALMLPCSHLLAPLPQIVRELAREQGKEADLVVGGEDIEIDRRVLDELKDPLMHLVRNCIAHGIENPEARRELHKPRRGSVSIMVRPFEGNRVELTVADDGAGIDVGGVRAAGLRLGIIATEKASVLADGEVTGLIFCSGLSTSPIITDLSGRGLGLAIVREKVEKLGGTIAVSSSPGAGTTFRMLLPLALAAFRGVFVAVAGQRFAIPTAQVVRVLRVRLDEIRTVENRQAISLDGCALSLVRLRDVLELAGPDERTDSAPRPVMVLRAAGSQAAFLVDEVQDEREVMIKSLGRQLVRVRNVAGACISGGVTVIPILNVADLVESAGRASAPGLNAPRAGSPPERRGRLLLAEDSITARVLVKSILEGAGYEVVAAVDGIDALTRLKAEPFDLLVSDVDMPRMNGFELTAKVRADRKLGELPVVLVTALGSQRDREYGIEVGANAYIVKSDFDQGNLLEIVRRLA